MTHYVKNKGKDECIMHPILRCMKLLECMKICEYAKRLKFIFQLKFLDVEWEYFIIIL